MVKFHKLKEFKRGDEYPDTFEADHEYPCSYCNCDHTHIVDFKGKIYRVCYDCGEVNEELGDMEG